MLASEKVREDVELSEYALNLGWTIVEPQPNFPFIFRKQEKNIWYCARGWVCADLIQKHYLNHRYYKTLKEALDNEV